MFKDKAVIGLDIGSESIKMVEVNRHEGIATLHTYGVARHTLNLDNYWDSSMLRQVSIIVEELLNTGSFKGVKTVMSFQSKDVYVTTMDFEDGWTDSMIQDEINKQAQYFLPYPPDEMRLSWNRINDDPRIKQYTGKQRVIINALPDFVVENSKNLLEHVNLDGAALENQTVSQIRANLTPDTGMTVLVDVGGRYTTFSMIVDGILRSSSHVNIGTDKIQEDISSSIGISIVASEAFKRDLSLVNLYHLPKQVLDTYLILKTELDSFIELNKRISQNPEKIIMTGGGVLSVGFQEYFQRYQIPVFTANNLRNMAVPDNLKPYIYPLQHQMATSIGLALRDDV